MVKNAVPRDSLLYRMKYPSRPGLGVLSRHFHENLIWPILLAPKQKVAVPARRPYNLAQFDKPAVTGLQSA
jgi:hypothetical protein